VLAEDLEDDPELEIGDEDMNVSDKKVQNHLSLAEEDSESIIPKLPSSIVNNSMTKAN